MSAKPDTNSDAKTDNGDILVVEGLKTYFPVRRGVLARVQGHVRAVDGVSLRVRRGKTLGLVGESGCGKTTVGRTILRLTPATEGTVRFDGVNVFAISRRRLRRLRQRMQIIFQDPVGSLNPRMTVGSIVGEALSVHKIVSSSKARVERVASLLERVGLSPAHAARYPHEFSGGQRQRIGIARALALNPDFIVCDEPVSALDVSIQSQILNLLSDLQSEMSLSYLFIAHNLAVIRHFSDDVAVMYLGKIAETSSSEDIYENPKHPYTQALLSAAPEPDPAQKSNRIILSGEVPSPMNPPTGCAFHPRCALSQYLAAEADQKEVVILRRAESVRRLMKPCVETCPSLRTAPESSSDHLVACHYAEQMAPDTLAQVTRELANRSSPD